MRIRETHGSGSEEGTPGGGSDDTGSEHCVAGRKRRRKRREKTDKTDRGFGRRDQENWPGQSLQSLQGFY